MKSDRFKGQTAKQACSPLYTATSRAFCGGVVGAGLTDGRDGTEDVFADGQAAIACFCCGVEYVNAERCRQCFETSRCPYGQNHILISARGCIQYEEPHRRVIKTSQRPKSRWMTAVRLAPSHFRIQRHIQRAGTEVRKHKVWYHKLRTCAAVSVKLPRPRASGAATLPLVAVDSPSM